MSNSRDSFDGSLRICICLVCVSVYISVHVPVKGWRVCVHACMHLYVSAHSCLFV